MALLHVFDLATETPGDNLRKVESFFNYFKSKGLSLHQPKQYLAFYT